VLLDGAYNIHSCSTIQEASAIAKKIHPSAILIDVASAKIGGNYNLPGASASIATNTSVVCMASISETTDYALRHGASGFVEKPFHAGSLLDTVRLAVARTGETAAAGTAEIPGAAYQVPRNHALLGNSPAIMKVIQRIALYARHDAPVLIYGESGTGKELAANAIHLASKRRKNRLMPVDCASIPENLAESILFGTVKGAFTGAVDKKGVFENAKGGTVFLDEIGELSLPVQAKFLRILETSSGSRLGSVDPIAYDVRVLAATNAQLIGESQRFRPELVNRINTLELVMPPLREHKEDIAMLVDSFLAEYSPGKRVSADAIRKIMAWDWPGNVRELKNVIHRAIVLSGTREELSGEDIEINSLAKGWQASLL
jgi:two-component system response regulator AtoC